MTKLILGRRAIAAGMATLIGIPAAKALSLEKMGNVPFTLDPNDINDARGLVDKDGFAFSNYRFPRCRLMYEDGSTTRWMMYMSTVRGNNNHGGRIGAKAVAIEVCAPDKHGMPRYAQLDVMPFNSSKTS